MEQEFLRRGALSRAHAEVCIGQLRNGRRVGLLPLGRVMDGDRELTECGAAVFHRDEPGVGNCVAGAGQQVPETDLGPHR